MDQKRIESIAKICHEAHKAYCEEIGETGEVCWSHLSQERKTAAFASVAEQIANPLTPEEAHNRWVTVKANNGWVWGKEKDFEKKTNPLMKPYSDVPDEQREKGILFITIVNRLGLGRDGGYSTSKALTNVDTKTATETTSDIIVIGNPDNLQLLCKAGSKRQGWMKSSKAMEVEGVGCLVQFTSERQSKDGLWSIAETSSFFPNTTIVPDVNNGRKLEKSSY